MREGGWQGLLVNNEWFDERRAELTNDLARKLWEVRAFPADHLRMIDAVSCGLGYFAEEQRWVLPLPNIHGRIHQAKCWRQYYGDQRKWRWMTAGGSNARNNHAKRGEPIGRVWDLPYLDREWPLVDGDLPWLWWTAGEWDCLVARLGRLPATCLTIGESASAHTVNAQSLLVEFGGPEVAQALLSKFRGVVVVYDADEPGDKGAVLLAGALNELAEEADIHDVAPNWSGVRAVNLRESPWFTGDSGYDFSDFVRGAQAGGHRGIVWLRDQASKSPVGKQAIAEMLHVDLETAMVSGQTFARPSLKIIDIEDLIEGGLNYGKALGSRAQGVYHLGIRAESGGWTYDEIKERNTHLAYIERCSVLFDKTHPFTEAEFYAQLRGAMQGTRRPEYLDTDHANMLRLLWYFNFFRYHPIRGWLYWNGVAWEPGDVKIHDQVDRIPDKIDEEAAEFWANGDEEMGKRLRKWAAVCRKNVARLNSLIDMASKRGPFRPRVEIGQGWDKQKHYLGTSEGVLDLDTSQFITGPDARDAYCSLRTRGRIVSRDSYDGDTQKCWEMWESLLADWQPDEAVRATLQEIAGTCLYGTLDEHFWILKSSGRSGKSTFMDALGTAMGTYAYKVSSSVLASTAGDNAKSSAMAMLDGKRMTVIDEVGGMKLDVEAIKQLTGERAIAGRAMRVDWAEVKNCSTYFAMANADLQWPELSEALIGRLWQITWPRSYVDHDRLDHEDNAVGVKEGWVRERDDRVKSIVNGEDPEFVAFPDVVLSWMFAGWERVRDRGHIQIADEIKRVTNLIWKESDVLGGYFSDPALWIKGGRTLVTTEGLWNNMRDWATRNGDSALYEALGDRSMVLSGMFRTRAARGFEPAGRVGKSAGALWHEKPQHQAWFIPYTYVGPK